MVLQSWTGQWGPEGSGGAEPTQLGPTLTVVLWDRVGRGGLGGRSPPSLELQWIVMTRMLQYVVHESAQFLQSPESGDAWRRVHEAEQWDALIPKNAPEAAAAKSAEAFSGWRNHPQRGKKRRGRTGRENDDDDNGGPGQVSVGRGGLARRSPPSLDLHWTVVLWDRVGRGGSGGVEPT